MWTLVLVTVIAVGKEIYDYFNPKKHTADLIDSLVTVIGGLVVVLSKAIQLILK
ncbi:hypothetical protein JCM16358_22990 [Halanaerocella petrolearia]